MSWDDFCKEHENAEINEEFLDDVNYFWNRNISYLREYDTGSDDWQTPKETLEKGMGDCEDYAIAKMVTLWKCGVPQEMCRLAYVKINREAHMVLNVYVDSDPVVLDNYIMEIWPLSERTDLKMIYEVNNEGLFVRGRKLKNNHSLWNKLVEQLNNDSSTWM